MCSMTATRAPPQFRASRHRSQPNLGPSRVERCMNGRPRAAVGAQIGFLTSRSVLWWRSAWPVDGQAEMCQLAGGLPGGSGDVSGGNVGGVAVQRGPGPVISHRGAWVSMGGGFLDIPQRHPGIQRRGDERVAQRVRPDGLGDPGPPGDAVDDPPGACRSNRRPSAVRKIGPSVRSPMARSIARAVRGASGIVTTFPPLRVNQLANWRRSSSYAWRVRPLYAARNPANARTLGIGEHRRDGDESGGRDRGGHQAPPGTQAETKMLGQPRPQQTTRTPP